MPKPFQTRSRIPRANGWTSQRKRLFFEALAVHGTVALACARVGLSREAAYKARRRDVDFAERWRQALECARVTAERAFLDGLPNSLRDAVADRWRSLEPGGSRFSPWTPSTPSA